MLLLSLIFIIFQSFNDNFVVSQEPSGTEETLEHPTLEVEQADDLKRLDQKLRELLGGDQNSEDETADLKLILDGPASRDYLAARIAEEEGDVVRAAHYWGQLANQYPDQVYVLNKAIPLMVITDDIDKVPGLLGISNAEIFSKSIEEKKLLRNPQIALTLFTNLINNQDFKSAGTVVEKLPSRDIYVLIKPILQAWLLAQNQKTKEAVALLDEVQKESVANQDFLLINKALLLHVMKADPSIIEKAYKEALERAKYPHYVLIEEYGRFLEEQGKIDQANEHYQTYAEQFDPLWFVKIEERLQRKEKPSARVQNPIDGMGFVMDMLADYFAHDGIIIPTLFYSQLTLRLDPAAEGALFREGVVWASLKDYDRALHFLTLIPITSHLYVDAQLKTAQVLENKGDLDGAIRSLQELSKIVQDRIEPLVTLGDVLRRNDRFEDAAKAYQDALKRIPTIEKDHWGVLFSLAISQERSNKWPEAEKNLLKALELNPDQADVLNYLGYSWVDRNMNLDKAFELLKKAAELRPDDGAIMDSLGWAYYRKGDYDQALAYLEKAIRHDPGDPVINDHLGDLYWKLNRKNEARFQWERVFVYKPDDQLTKSVKEKLAKGLEEK